MKCAIFLAGVACFCSFTLSSNGLDEEDFQCLGQVHYQENDCNICRCLAGDLACTRRACKSHDDPAFTNCEVGTTWTKDCNKCWCVEDVHTVCTFERC